MPTIRDGNRRTGLVLHTSALSALFDPTDEAHEVCSDFAGSGSLLIVPLPCVVDADRSLRARGARPMSHHLADAVVLGEPRPLRLESGHPDDWSRIQEVEDEYGFDLVDAFVVAVAERLGATRIATLDRRFADVRPNHAETFELLP